MKLRLSTFEISENSAPLDGYVVPSLFTETYLCFCCLGMVIGTPGQCPFYPRVRDRNPLCFAKQNCDTDVDCGFAQKCCENPCGVTRCHNITEQLDPLSKFISQLFERLFGKLCFHHYFPTVWEAFWKTLFSTPTFYKKELNWTWIENWGVELNWIENWVNLLVKWVPSCWEKFYICKVE